jgi:hypothetical protein
MLWAMEFRLIPASSNPMLQSILRMLAITAVAALLFITTLYLLRLATLNAMLFFNISVVVSFPFIAWSLASSYRGSVIGDETGFEVKSSMRGSYRWPDVAAIRITNLAETSGRVSAHMLNALRVNQTQPFVEIKLRRRPRVSFFRNRRGTDVTLGVPILTTRLGLFLRDPTEFVRYASGFVTP